MSEFFHKIEDAFHGHHHNSTSEQQSHSTKSASANHAGDSQHETPHTHHHNTRQNAHRRSQAENDRADFLADREYDRDLRSPDHGPGLGFET